MVQTLWDTITEFLAGGDRRTEALQEGIRENVTPFVPPNLREPLGLLAEVNPVQDIYRAGGNMRGGNYVDAGVDTAIAAAPVVGGVLGRVGANQLADTGGDAARAAMDTLLGGAPGRSTSAVDAFAERANQRGPVPTMYSNPIDFKGQSKSPPPTPRNDAEAMAREILDMRAAGRAGDVTDEMMAQADPQYMFANTPLPMDEASRMARAREMGFEGDWYHGTQDGSFSAFRAGPHDEIDLTGVSVSPDASEANWYAANRPDFAPGMQRKNPAVMPVKTRGVYGHEDDILFAPEDMPTSDIVRGMDGVDFPQFNERFVFDPANIRSRFARFDPEFSHLRNLSAGIAGGGLLATQDTEQQREEEIRQYLGGLL